MYLLSVSGSQIVGTSRKQGEGKLRLVWSVAGKEQWQEKKERPPPPCPARFSQKFSRIFARVWSETTSAKVKNEVRETQEKGNLLLLLRFLPSFFSWLKNFFPRLWNNQEARILGTCLVPGRLCEKSRVRLPIWTQILEGRCDAMYVLSPNRRRSISVKQGHGRGTSS